MFLGSKWTNFKKYVDFHPNVPGNRKHNSGTSDAACNLRELPVIDTRWRYGQHFD